MSLTTLLNKIKKIIRLQLAKLPVRVPLGLTEYDVLIDQLISLYNPPMSKRDVQFVIAASLQRLEPKEKAKRSLQSHYNELCRAACTQIGGHMIYVIKQEQKAELDKQQAEATAKVQAASDGPVQEQKI